MVSLVAPFSSFFDKSIFECQQVHHHLFFVLGGIFFNCLSRNSSLIRHAAVSYWQVYISGYQELWCEVFIAISTKHLSTSLITEIDVTSLHHGIIKLLGSTCLKILILSSLRLDCIDDIYKPSLCSLSFIL